MKTFTGWQYLLIDVANAFGLDKEVFEKRIEWAEENLAQLEALTDKAETKPLYVKAVMAIRKVQKGMPTGHLVGFDAVCSGVQIMSAITGCEAGARATGLIDTGERPDAYSTTTKVMNEVLAAEGLSVSVPRKDAKTALMTSFYGSKAQPKKIFGEDTPELKAFYQAAQIVAPGAWQLLQELLDSWQPYALAHSWQLPDGFQARVKVMVRQDVRIEVDELDHATFEYSYYENEGTKRGLSNVANVIHSIDAYVLRSVHRRCNYDAETVVVADNQLRSAWVARNTGYYKQQPIDSKATDEVMYYIGLYECTGMADVVILPYLLDDQVHYLSDEHIEDLIRITEKMLEHKPFDVVTIHDEFKCHPNNMNQLRYWYKEILAELADSVILADILGQLYGMRGSYQKLSPNLGAQIRESNYALC